MKTYVLFWIKSSKGTDDLKVIAFAGRPTKARIEDRLEVWCKAHSCWDIGDNCISSGWCTIKMPLRRDLMKSYNKASERKRKADERWRLLAAMLNPMATTY